MMKHLIIALAAILLFSSCGKKYLLVINHQKKGMLPYSQYPQNDKKIISAKDDREAYASSVRLYYQEKDLHPDTEYTEFFLYNESGEEEVLLPEWVRTQIKHNVLSELGKKEE